MDAVLAEPRTRPPDGHCYRSSNVASQTSRTVCCALRARCSRIVEIQTADAVKDWATCRLEGCQAATTRPDLHESDEPRHEEILAPLEQLGWRKASSVMTITMIPAYMLLGVGGNMMFDQYWRGFENWYWALPQHTQLMLAAIFVFWLLFNLFYNEKAVSFGPTILTTLGIFATFLGIALGLSEFDSNNIQASVPALLGGLKTAFWASVAGVGGALLLKFRHQFFDRTAPEGTGEDGEVTGADLARLLSGIQAALVGSEETSLITQIKLMRSDTNDRLDALKAAQLQALQELSKMGSQALVEALRDVIKDFNAKITEQFGDNFRALNEAVGQLLIWQERYRLHVERSEASLETLVTLMGKTTSDYSSLVSHSQSFSTVADDLGKMLDALSTQKIQLVDLSRALAGLLKEASGSLPAVETKIMELTAQLSNAVQDNQKSISAALTENAQQLKNAIQSSHQGFVATNTEANKQVTELMTKTKEQISNLDAALTEELKKSLESLGRQLAALSERFVSDYGPLTDKLRRVVEMAKIGVT